MPSSKYTTYHVYSSATRAWWDRFDPVLLRIGPVYHSSGQSFNAFPVFGSISNHCAIACCQVPLLRGRSGMLISMIGRLVALVRVLWWSDSVFKLWLGGRFAWYSIGVARCELGSPWWNHGLIGLLIIVWVSIPGVTKELIGGVTIVWWGMNEFAVWSIERVAELNIWNSFVVTGCTRTWSPMKLLSASVGMGQRASL